MDLGNLISYIFCLPFVGMLLSIAIFPLIAPAWWEKKKGYIVVLWSLLYMIPFAVKAGFRIMGEQLLEVIVGDYFTFIVLLLGLFCVAGNINLKGNFIGSPRVNVIFLLTGTLLAGWIGTTGASMVMIRPLLRANRWRKRKMHIVIFFIFLVSNIGGCLTPIGDPPLLMGFTRGVPFFYSMSFLPVMGMNVIILLAVFFCLDYRAYRKDIAEGVKPGEEVMSDHMEKVRINGAHNIIFLGMIIAAVILSGILPATNVFSGGIPIYGKVELSFSALIEVIIILTAMFLSFKTTKHTIRAENHFSWGPIREVAVLFAGIFITMIPVLAMLQEKGAGLGLDKPWQMFWVTGAMSSFLDNTPTYLVFLTVAGTLGVGEGICTTVGVVPYVMLRAISCGAVFMGANTYIGNAPNFMVKAIAEENGVRMPSFFSYIWWSVRFLIPVFIIDTILFF